MGNGPGQARAVTVVAHDVRRDGGMENVMRETIVALLEGGWRVRLYAKSCDLESSIETQLDFRRVRTPRRPFVFSYPLFALVVGVRLLFERPDGMLFSVGANIPNKADVIAVHYCHAVTSSKGFKRAARRGALRGVSSAIGRKMALAGERWCYRAGRVNAIITVSGLLREEILASFSLATVPINVIPNGVDLEHFKPNPSLRRQMRHKLDIADDALVGVFVGGDWERKGLRTAMTASASAGWGLIVVGRGDQLAWQDAADELGLDACFTGHVPDASPYLVAADAFLLPSSYEGFALVTLEAAASGLPVLVTAATGAADLVAQSGAATLPQSAEAFAEALRHLGSDPQRREQLSQSTQAAARDYSWEVVRSLYRSTLDRINDAQVDASQPNRG
jgi:glycosyltransferase involved in cell wall biosynthesis